MNIIFRKNKFYQKQGSLLNKPNFLFGFLVLQSLSFPKGGYFWNQRDLSARLTASQRWILCSANQNFLRSLSILLAYSLKLASQKMVSFWNLLPEIRKSNFPWICKVIMVLYLTCFFNRSSLYTRLNSQHKTWIYKRKKIAMMNRIWKSWMERRCLLNLDLNTFRINVKGKESTLKLFPSVTIRRKKLLTSTSLWYLEIATESSWNLSE